MMWRRSGLVVGAVAAFGLVIAAMAKGDDRANAAALVQSLEQDSAHKVLTADALAHAKDATARAAKMRAAGDETHARIADGLALEWAETARDLVRAVQAENQAADARRDALDAGARAERERQMLEEGIARTGRLRAELDAREREAKRAPERTSPLGADAGSSETARPGNRPTLDLGQGPRPNRNGATPIADGGAP
jgi:hypothetical protein